MCCYRIYAWIWREDSNLLNSYVVLAKILFKNATPPPPQTKWMTLNSGFSTNLTLCVSPLVSFNAIILT